MKQPLLLVGGGLHCKTCIDVIEQEGRFYIKGIVDKKEKVGGTILGYPIIATDEEIPELARECPNFFITVGDVNLFAVRNKLFKNLTCRGVSTPTIISPLSYVSPHTTIGEGSILFPFSIIDVGSKVGNNCIINHAATLLHEATVEDNCHISVNSVIGNSLIGHDTFIGVNSFVNNGLEIAPHCIIGSGSNVIRSIIEPGVYVGNPAKKIKDLEV